MVSRWILKSFVRGFSTITSPQRLRDTEPLSWAFFLPFRLSRLPPLRDLDRVNLEIASPIGSSLTHHGCLLTRLNLDFRRRASGAMPTLFDAFCGYMCTRRLLLISSTGAPRNGSAVPGVYYDEKCNTILGSALVRDPKFQDRVVAEPRALVATIRAYSTARTASPGGRGPLQRAQLRLLRRL